MSSQRLFSAFPQVLPWLGSLHLRRCRPDRLEEACNPSLPLVLSCEMGT